MEVSRRYFMQSAAVVSLGFRGLQTLLADPPAVSESAQTVVGYGPLVADTRGVLDLPAGFSYRVVSRVGDRMDDGLIVPGNPDGMAAFPGPNGKTILVRNHELYSYQKNLGPFGPNNELLHKIDRDRLYDAGRSISPGLGGTTTVVYDTKTGRVETQFLSLAGTEHNCAGGPTPWGSWISCEETVSRADEAHEQDHGYNFEVPIDLGGGAVLPEPIKAMGRFNHEAIALDPRTGIVYQTEDRDDALLYRYIPNQPGKLIAGGRLQALRIREQKSLDTRNWLAEEAALIAVAARFKVEWLDLDEIDAPDDNLRYRGYDAGAARFARTEGIWYGHDAAYIACTTGGLARKGQIWKYIPSQHEGTPREMERPGVLELFVEPNDPGVVNNADNLTIAPWGDLIVCEDSEAPRPHQRLVGVTPAGHFYHLARNAIDSSEFAGVTFSPDGTTLFVNLQLTGLTLAISGPWRNRAYNA